MKSNLKHHSFLDPAELLQAVPAELGNVVADFGCGNGYYSVSAAQIVGSKGQVFALDIMEDALSQTASLAKTMGLSNISTRLCDLEKSGGAPINDTSCDLVIISSLLHQVEKKDIMLKEAYRVLKTGGKLLVVEWKPDANLGPAVSSRIAKNETAELLEKHGFRPISEIPAGSFHYGFLYSK